LGYFENLILSIERIFEAQEIIKEKAEEEFIMEEDIVKDKQLEIMYFERII